MQINYRPENTAFEEAANAALGKIVLTASYKLLRTSLAPATMLVSFCLAAQRAV